MGGWGSCDGVVLCCDGVVGNAGFCTGGHQVPRRFQVRERRQAIRV